MPPEKLALKSEGVTSCTAIAHSLTRPLLRAAGAYQVPALVPHSLLPEQYRAALGLGGSVADEAQNWLRQQDPTQEGKP